ncbi:ferredoxin reductase family protein [Myxococcus virescens]|nr:ferric reductase-like transmembrane domain-containing protein [Myxococcus virescens]SDE36227.1 Predicted ferric reductase [Myxococcus virescens]
MNRVVSGFFWISLYLLVVLVPVFLMLIPPAPSGRSFWLELSVALGFVGLTQIAVQFVLIARFKRITAPYGIDIILQYHRQIAMVAVCLVLAHPLIIVIDNPSRLKLLNPLGGNWASRCALLSVLALVTLVVSSQFRERLKINYERWRLLHLLLGVAAIVFAQLHVSMAGLYTNTPWKHAIWVVTSVAMVALVVYLRVLRPAWQRNYHWRVAEVRTERGGTHSLVLEPVGNHGMRFAPGQFAWLKLEGSPFTLEEHPFSFSSSAERSDRLEFGIKSLGDFSGRMGGVPPGTRAFLDGPHGAFSIDRYPAVGYVFIAGGVGITPILSFLRTMADRKDPRPVTLFYADTAWESVAFREALTELEEKVNLHCVYVLKEPADDWKGERGVLTGEVLDRHLPKEKLARFFFICGPPPMMAAVHEALRERDVPEAHIHLEKFNLA